MKLLLYILMVCQLVLCGLLMFGDIGFDKAGRYGMDYDSGIIIVGLYGLVLLAGLIVAFGKKRWVLGCIQLVPILALIASLFLPEPRYDPAKYQYLVGKTRAEAEKTIGHPRGLGTGATNVKGPDLRFLSVHGMIIYFSDQDVVLYVEKSDW